MRYVILRHDLHWAMTGSRSGGVALEAAERFDDLDEAHQKAALLDGDSLVLAEEDALGREAELKALRLEQKELWVFLCGLAK